MTIDCELSDVPVQYKFVVNVHFSHSFILCRRRSRSIVIGAGRTGARVTRVSHRSQPPQAARSHERESRKPGDRPHSLSKKLQPPRRSLQVAACKGGGEGMYRVEREALGRGHHKTLAQARAGKDDDRELALMG